MTEASAAGTAALRSEDEVSFKALTGRRIVVICQGLPHPSRGASRVLFYYYVEGLLEAGVKVTLLVLDEGASPPEERDVESLREMLAARGEIEIRRVPGFPLLRHGLFGLSPEEGVARKVEEAVGEAGGDLALIFDWQAAAVAQDLEIPRVVWLGDLQFETLYYHTKFAMEEGSRRYDRRLLLPLRMAQLKRFYARILAGASIIVSSKSSEERMAALGLRSAYLPYPWPPLPQPDPRPEKAATPSFLFSGTLQALGSRAAFHALFRDVYPRLKEAFGAGGFAVLITGLGELPGWVAAEVEKRPEIRHLGYVDDLAAVMATATAFMAPIDVPVGNRSRILTCMAAGLPVVAHPYTALGNPLLRDGETCLLASTPDDFVSRLVALSRDSDLAEALSRRAEQAYAAHHFPGVASALLVQYLSGTLSKG
ncbi:glycosyltransferase [Afifella sp. IM 167]|uniref:glycosyltransferase n=1 Tax=Afifella sp. IM 167 TaxID=2033586 RepID=UPI001CCA6E19|nr:glycosyltransferase [Afifella sp. IM 167]MBZ8134242.1 hypothetical protein [Afifella sp. IM 167]